MPLYLGILFLLSFMRPVRAEYENETEQLYREVLDSMESCEPLLTVKEKER